MILENFNSIRREEDSYIPVVDTVYDISQTASAVDLVILSRFRV